MSFKVKNNVTWVGKIDWELRKFHGDEYRRYQQQVSQIIPMPPKKEIVTGRAQENF